MNESAWDKREIWAKQHEDFQVEIWHRTTDYNTAGEGFSPNNNIWNVYGLISEEHPLYRLFSGEDIFQDAIQSFPLHGGSTFCQHQRISGTQFYRVGSDYAHYRDDRFRGFVTLDEAEEVREDAEELFEYLLQNLGEENK